MYIIGTRRAIALDLRLVRRQTHDSVQNKHHVIFGSAVTAVITEQLHSAPAWVLRRHTIAPCTEWARYQPGRQQRGLCNNMLQSK